MVWRVVTPPATEPLSLAEAKAHCRVQHNAEDGLLGALIVAARQHIEITTNRALITQQWLVSLPCLRGVVRLPGGVVQSIDSFEVDGEPYTGYQARLIQPAVLVPSTTWPIASGNPDAVNITITVGYGDADDVPQDIKLAMLLLISHWYSNRSAVIVGAGATPLPLAVQSLLFPYTDAGLI